MNLDLEIILVTVLLSHVFYFNTRLLGSAMIHSFVHLFGKYLLNTYCVLGIALDSEFVAVNMSLTPSWSYILVECSNNIHRNKNVM